MEQDHELIKQLLDLVRQMIILADQGQAVAQDDGCRLLYGIVQDSAYKIRMVAQKERELHRQSGGLKKIESMD